MKWVRGFNSVTINSATVSIVLSATAITITNVTAIIIIMPTILIFRKNDDNRTSEEHK